MEGKKISFGFLKTKKQDKPVVAEKKDYIECVEEKSIKVLGGEVVEEKKALVIAMKPNTLITAEKLREIAERAENFDDIKEIKSEKEREIKEIPVNETLDQMAARELLDEAQKEVFVDTPKLVVPINAKPIMAGQSESTLDDYESVPIQEFGLAMLRGMGWTQSKESTYKPPQLRPKGLGLGADKVITDSKKNKNKDKEEELPIIKNSLVKVTTGKYSNCYGKVVSLDEDNGRVVVELTIKKETVSLSEFMVQAVPKSEFDKESKVINTESYEQYKRKDNIQTHNTNKRDKSSSSHISRQDEGNRKETERNSNGSKRRSRSRENRRYRRDSYSSEDRSRHRKREKKKYSSNETLSSDSDEHKSIDRRKREKKYSSNESLSQDSDRRKPVYRRGYSSNDSSNSEDRRKHKKNKSKSSKERRDIDKKRKGKKKKRDRDRSPNVRKHRK